MTSCALLSDIARARRATPRIPTEVPRQPIGKTCPDPWGTPNIHGLTPAKINKIDWFLPHGLVCQRKPRLSLPEPTKPFLGSLWMPPSGLLARNTQTPKAPPASLGEHPQKIEKIIWFLPRGPCSCLSDVRASPSPLSHSLILYGHPHVAYWQKIPEPMGHPSIHGLTLTKKLRKWVDFYRTALCARLSDDRACTSPKSRSLALYGRPHITYYKKCPDPRDTPSIRGLRPMKYWENWLIPTAQPRAPAWVSCKPGWSHLSSPLLSTDVPRWPIEKNT